MEETKKPWQSKTLWLNLIMALVAVLGVWFPGVKDLVNEQVLLMLLPVVNLVLRLITKKPIAIE